MGELIKESPKSYKEKTTSFGVKLLGSRIHTRYSEIGMDHKAMKEVMGFEVNEGTLEPVVKGIENISTDSVGNYKTLETSVSNGGYKLSVDGKESKDITLAKEIMSTFQNAKRVKLERNDYTEKYGKWVKELEISCTIQY